MAYTVSGVVIKQGDRYLMLQEKKPQCFGQWNWPAGHVDEGETVEAAAIREAKEEVGLDVELGEKIGEWDFPDAGRTMLLHMASSCSGELAIRQSEIIGAAWLTRDEILALSDTMRLPDWSVDLFKDGVL